MLRILTSNQPIVWAFVPVSGVVLFLISAGLGLVSTGSWTGLAAVLVSSRLIHLMHNESGMRTRPSSIPSWVWTIVATPFLGLVPDGTWWGVPFLLQGLRQAMGLRDTEGRPGQFFFIAVWWSFGVLVEAALWPELLACILSVALVRRASLEELLAALIGLGAPILCFEAVMWLDTGRLFPVGIHRSISEGRMPLHLLWWLLPTAMGWLIRQQSLVRATAQQRYARQITQWAGLLMVVLTATAQVLGFSGVVLLPDVLCAAPMVLAFAAGWSWSWLMPPGFRVTRWTPLLFFLGALGLLWVRWAAGM